MNKLVRITTVPVSLQKLLEGQLRYMSNYFEVLGVSSPGPELSVVKEKEKVRTAEVSMTRSISPVKDMIALTRLVLLFRKERPLIVHTHTPKAGLLGMIAAKICRVRFRLHTVAGLPIEEATGVKFQVLRFTERITSSMASRVYPNSKYLESYMVDKRLAKERKLKVIANGSSNGINLKYYNPSQDIQNEALNIKKELKITEKDKVFCFIGRLVKDKGLVELVTSFSQVLENYPYAKLLILGREEERMPKVINQILNDTDHIIKLGYQTDIRPYLVISDFFVFPSYREGFPNVVLQACAFNMPCIVTDIAGSNEIISNGVNGLVVPKKDEKALLEAMTWLIENPDEAKSMGMKSRSLIKEKYDQNFFWESLKEEYISLIDDYV